jgi:CheY-like chemotaxis protein
LLVGRSAVSDERLARQLRAAGFRVAQTRNRAAAIVYGKELAPDLVLCDARTAHVLRSFYPDGPLWFAVWAIDGLTLLRGAHADERLVGRARAAVEAAALAA